MVDSNKPLDCHKGLMPYQDCPNSCSYHLWKRVLKKFCVHPFELAESLGLWLVSGKKLHQQWRCLYDCNIFKVFLYKYN